MGTPKGNFVVPRNFDPEQKRFAQSLNESVAVLRGELGDPLDAAVTYNDLIDSGIAKRDLRIGSGGFIGGPGRVIIIPGDGTVLDIPPAPTGVEVSGAFQNIIITWDAATFVGFSYAEIWTATSNTFADRVLVGTSTASVFSHQVGNGQTRYYWIRFVNIQGVIGPFNSTTGIGDSTVIDIGAQMALLSEGLQNLPGYVALTTLITNADVAVAATAAVAARVIRSSGAPTTREDSSALTVNDIWFDIDDGQVYTRNAANNDWVAGRDATLVSVFGATSFTGSTLTGAMAAAQSDIVTVTNAQSSTASSLTSLTSTVGTNTSAISTEQTTRANADTALATSITNLTSTVGSNTSAISSEATTRASADTANATAITNLTSTVGAANASITSLQTVTTNLSNDASAAYVLQVNANGSVAGMVIEANASGAGDNSGSAIQFVSDKFAIWNGTSGTAPFIVDSGIVYIKEALIEDGSITNAKIGTLSADKITTGGMSADRITAGTISTDRLDASVIVATDLSANTSTVIHGGNITTGTISANRLDTSVIVATDLSTNTSTVIHGGNISTNTITADKINVTNLALDYTAATVSGSTIGGFANNQMRLHLVAELGTEPGLYHIFCRVFGGNGQVKTLSIVAGDGTWGSGSSFQLRSDFAYQDGPSPTIPTLDQGYAQYHSGQTQYWSAINRFDSSYEMVQKDFIVRKVSSTSSTLRLFVLGQGDNGTRYLSNVQYGFYKFSEI
tara:strand:- start:525 stop:2732 length:2208 start_codon:yes stop_codon:yes gene_type:complete